MKLRLKLILLAGCCVCATAPAAAKTEFRPYLQVEQVIDAPLKGGGDVLTYTSVGGGIDATIESRRSQVLVSYNYERRIGYGKSDIGDSDIHSGLVQGSYQIVPNFLSVEAGGLATRGRSDIRGAAPNRFGPDDTNVSKVYQVYGGPTLETQLGALDVGASYRASYTAVNGSNFVPAVGQQRLDSYDESISHAASASVGMAPGRLLPFGWNVAGQFSREDASQLDERFESKGVRGDIVFPVTQSLALVGGVGYEKLTDSRRNPVLDTAGNPVVNARGRFVTNKASPRILGYDFDGVYWDAGVQWRPSNRTSAQFAVGRRYGSMSYTGSLSWAMSEHSGIQLGVYDQVETFGGQLNGAVTSLPNSLSGNSNGLGQQFGGCTFGRSGKNKSAGGGCLNSALGSISTGLFRSRGVSLQWAGEYGRLNYGLGAGYSQRKFLAPNLPGSFSINGAKDEQYFVDGDIGYALTARSSISANAYGAYFNSGLAGAPGVYNAGVTGGYQHQIGRHLEASAALGIYTFKVDGNTGDINMNAQVGMRYSF